MAAYVARRLFFSIFVLWGAVSVIFLVLRLVPGDPAVAALGPDADTSQIEALRERWGLNKSLVEQYVIYVSDVVKLDFGESFRTGVDAMSLVADRIPNSAQLALASLTLSLLIGFPLGIAAALSANSVLDRTISVFSLVAQSTPAFWVGIVFILVFARTLNVLPSAGMGDLQHLVLPAITLALPFLAILVRLTRSGLLEVIHEGCRRKVLG